MALFNFNDAERELLLALMLEHVVSHSVAYEGDAGQANRARLVEACRIVAELHDPTATLSDVPVIDSERLQQRELAAREGIDLDKELGPMDPRAFAPRCTHGKLFSEVCLICADRCAHGLTKQEPCAACGRGILGDGGPWPLGKLLP